MSGLPATFPCPWCGMSYPAKPVLIGKPVRCKGCRNAFVLQADGIALKHEDPPPAAVAPPAPPAPLPAAPPRPAAVPAPVPPRPAAPPPVPPRPVPASPAPAVAEEVIEFGEPAAPSTPTPPPAAVPAEVLRTPRPGERPSSERVAKASRKGKTEQLEAARAKMAADLAAVAAKAANTEVAKREERRSERLVKAGGAPAKPGDEKRRSRKAVLTGEGERLHRERVLWLVGSLVVVGLVVLLMVVLSFRSGIRAALDAYAADPPDSRFMAYSNAVHARSWLSSTPSQPSGTTIARELDDAVFGAQRVIELGPAKEAFAQLKGLRRLSGTGWWVPPGDEGKARSALAAPPIPGESTARALARGKIRAVEEKAWLAKLNLPEDDRAVVLDLLAGTPSKEGVDFAKRMLDEGEVPDRLFLRPFSGRNGDLRLDLGPPPYKSFTGPYRGMMMRVEGAGWPSGWKVLALEALVDQKKD